MIPARSFLEKRYGGGNNAAHGEDAQKQELFELQDAVHLALLTLKEGFEGQMSPDNVQIGIVDASGKFRIAEKSELSDYLQNL
jgi:20S proteasome subunit alpha 2